MNKLIASIYNKKLEIHYNEWYVRKDDKKIKLELKGKIKCPILNSNISSITCSSLMDRTDWPRGIDKDICSKCNCYINMSIAKFKNKHSKEQS